LFTRIRRAHYLFAASLFGLLGFHVGVWAVQLAALSAGLHLDPAALGAAVTVAAAAGLVSLFAGGTLADRVGRRPVLVIGLAGTGTAFVLIALAGRIATPDTGRRALRPVGQLRRPGRQHRRLGL
jgi:MFS family permease